MRSGAMLNKAGYAVVLITIIAFSAALLLIHNPSITGGVAVQSISYLQEGKQLHFEIRDIPFLQEATITVVDDVKNAKIIFEEASPPATFNGYFLSAFKISSESENHFGRIELLFKIKKSDLSSIDEQDLAIYSAETELATSLVKTDGEYLFYRAASDTLGTFVIGRQEAKVGAEDEEKTAPEEAEIILPVIQEPAPVKVGWFRSIINFFKRFFSG